MLKKQLKTVFTTARQDERGGVLSIFVVITFLTLILFAGAGIDFMRFESDRNKLQTNLDNAVLAAAALRNNTDRTPEQIFNNYLNASDMSFQYTAALTKSEIALGSRNIEAEAQLQVGTTFLKLAGLNSLDHVAASGARERSPNLELTMVLDISGSMTDIPDDGVSTVPRIDALRPAAVKFIEGMLPASGNNDQNVSVNIVPYAHGISLGPDLWNAVFSTAGGIGGSWCAEFEDSAFDTIGKPLDGDAEPMVQFSRDFGSTDTTTWTLNDPYCREDEVESQITVASNRRQDLIDQINALEGGGWTSIHDAAKWGFALLDPSMQGVFQTMSNLENSNPKRVPSSFTSGLNVRPAQYDDETTLKVMVLMTDGANTRHYVVKPEYRTSVDPVTGIEDKPEAYLRETGDLVDATAQPIVDGNGDQVQVSREIVFDTADFETVTVDGVDHDTSHLYSQMGWDELWNSVSTRYYENENNITYDTVIDQPLDSNQMDARAEALCDLAKEEAADGDAKVVIFTIAYSAPQAGQDLMSYCATPGFYYNASPDDIEGVFQSILETVVKLRLSK